MYAYMCALTNIHTMYAYIHTKKDTHNAMYAYTCANKYTHNVRLHVRANKVPGSGPTVRGHIHLRVTRGVLIFLST